MKPLFRSHRTALRCHPITIEELLIDTTALGNFSRRHLISSKSVDGIGTIVHREIQTSDIQSSKPKKKNNEAHSISIRTGEGGIVFHRGRTLFSFIALALGFSVQLSVCLLAPVMIDEPTPGEVNECVVDDRRWWVDYVGELAFRTNLYALEHQEGLTPWGRHEYS